MQDYQQFIRSKKISIPNAGFDPDATNPNAFDYQQSVTRWSLRKGKAGVFLDTGLGKTMVQLDNADQVCRRTNGRVLILCPLAVANQTKTLAAQYEIQSPVSVVSNQGQVGGPGIYLTNYEKLHKFAPSEFIGVCLDEGSILKSLDGKTRTKCIEMFSQTPYRFVFTATPSPNDVMEIGNYAEFLGIMSRAEMLAMFFVHDGGNTSKWRLKGHAKQKFFEWLSSWCVMARSPEDLGFDGSRFVLPELRMYERMVNCSTIPEGHLFQTEALTLHDQRAARRDSLNDRVKELARIVNATDEPFLVWCELNDESTAACAAIPDAVELTGGMKDHEKESAIDRFLSGDARVLVSKPSICGFGLNFQHACKMAFLGVSHSFEQTYQAIRREWRFGQTRPVDVYLILSDREGAVKKNLLRKQKQHETLVAGVVSAMRDSSRDELSQIRGRETYRTIEPVTIPQFLNRETVNA